MAEEDHTGRWGAQGETVQWEMGVGGPECIAWGVCGGDNSLPHPSYLHPPPHTPFSFVSNSVPGSGPSSSSNRAGPGAVAAASGCPG